MSGHSVPSAGEFAAAIVARFPATPNQLMIWRKVQAAPEKACFNAVFRRRFVGRISDEAIARAMQALVDRHEILRTAFREAEDAKLYQHVIERVRFKLDHVDLRTLAEHQRSAELIRLGTASAQQPFAFTAEQSLGPLFRALLIRVSADEAHLYLTFHQLVIDGWSLDLVVREIGTLAAAAAAGADVGCPPVQMHFGDYARWQADLLTGSALDEDRNYWRTRLADLPDFRVAPDREGNAEGNHAEIRSILLPRELSDAFEAVARRTNNTLFSLASAAAVTALQSATGAAEVVFGTQMAGREDPDSEAIVGPLVNTVLLRVPTPFGSKFMDVLENVRTSLSEAMAHQLLPFAEVDHLVSRMRGNDAPSYRVNLVVQRTYISSATVHDASYGSFRIESVAAPSVGAAWDLSLFMVGRAEGWRLSCEYPPDLYDAETIRDLLDGWRNAMQRAVSSLDFPLSGHALMPRTTEAAVSPSSFSGTVNPRLDALRERVLALQPNGRSTPVIAINNVSVLYPVAQAVGQDHPFYDIQFCPAPTREALRKRHFTDHARDAVEMIRLARPHGPYILFGLCVMGALAIEAARILQSEGETVELVVLNDTYRPGYRENLGFVDRTIRALQVERVAMRKLWRRVVTKEVPLSEFLAKGLGRTGLPKLFAGLRAGNTPIPVHDHVADGNRWFIEDVLTPSQAELDFKSYSGRVLLFRNMEMTTGRLFPRDFGWEGYVDGAFEVVMCPGNHDTMFRTAGAEVIGATLRRVLHPNG